MMRIEETAKKEETKKLTKPIKRRKEAIEPLSSRSPDGLALTGQGLLQAGLKSPIQISGSNYSAQALHFIRAFGPALTARPILTALARSVGTKEWIGNVPDPVSSIVVSKLLDCNE
ncbi:hypothetical protein MTR_7g098675 [Medicago truncatula]|uniref:Uncharacterized protein n=1 Tax=Medicago truncatula TaxID=3880 RepID=A0A072U4D1_MEDTR|nr:hypothetical protein MTR_7g098675 [Medicago truncatula]